MMNMKTLAVSLLLSTVAGSTLAAECAITVTANDAMQFDTKAIDVSNSCKEFTVNLKHSGSLPKNVMGHNWVLTKTEDKQAVANDGMTAGVASNYIKTNDSRVIAATALIGGGESTSVTFPIDKLATGTAYTFFCSYPGHNAIMQGSLTLK